MMICRLLSTMKSVILIALAAMFTIANTEARPTKSVQVRDCCNVNPWATEAAT